ncbi:hypothetical protein NIES2109_22920 [Nostoc sp. HK-01]|nr:hypothetical protein NIES2109_22920 [Nostoc sp. HK-01]
MAANTTVLNSLPTVGQDTTATAQLIDNLGKTVYTFLYNPEAKSFSVRASYKEGAAALTSLPSQSYQYTTGSTLSLDNLILESWARSKSITPLLNSLKSLMQAEPTRGKYAPSPVTFVWGANKFGLAVITDLNWTETAWISGEPASARVSMKLIEIPLLSKAETPQQRLQTAAAKEQARTAREKAEATAKANQYLQQNLKSLNATIAQVVRSKSFTLKVSDMGVVTISDKKGNVLGTIGTYTNGKLTDAGRTLK